MFLLLVLSMLLVTSLILIFSMVFEDPDRVASNFSSYLESGK